MTGLGIDLTSQSEQTVKEFVDSFDTILCDLDFTVWQRFRPRKQRVIPGVAEVLTKFCQLGKKVIFVTNSSHASREQYSKELEEEGLAHISNHVVFPISAIGQHLSRSGFEGRIHIIGSDPQREELRSWGLRVDDEVEYPRAQYSALSLLALLKKDPEVKVVISDFDPNLSYLKLMQAVVLLGNPDCRFFSTATETILTPISNVRFIAIGTFTDMLHKASGTVPIQTGKPLPFMAELLIKNEGLNPARTLVVGDTLVQDVGFGISAGMPTLFVPGDHKQSLDPDYIPTYYAPTLGHLLPVFNSL